MTERNIVLRFRLRSLERAGELARNVLVTVQKSGKIASDARKELAGAIRERIAQARLLRQGATATPEGPTRARARRSGALFARDDDFATAGQAENIIGRAARIGSNLSAGNISNSVLRLLPAAGLTLLATQVWDLIRDQFDAQIQRALDERVAAVQLDARTSLLRSEDRARQDVRFDRRLANEAAAELERRRAAQRRVGLTPLTADLVLTPGDG